MRGRRRCWPLPATSVPPPTCWRAARTKSWRRFLLVSTGSVFQLRADTKSPILEDEATAPANVYSTTKVCAEQLTRMYRTEYGLSASTVRISWVYGPPVISDQPTRGPIPSYCCARCAEKQSARAAPDFAASFTFVGDVAEGLLAAASAPELALRTYHLGPGVNFTVGQVAAAVRKAVPGAVFELGPGTEPWTRYTSIRGPLAGDKLLADTGYAPTHSLEAAWARMPSGCAPIRVRGAGSCYPSSRRPKPWRRSSGTCRNV